MKHIMVIIFLLVGFKFCRAQNVDELVRQKQTQKKYLIEQISALQTHIGYAKQGYSIVTKGLNTIRDIKNADFDLHNNFFTSLSVVNPKIKKYSKVASILAMQLSVTKMVHNTIKQCSRGLLTNVELNYLQQVFNNVLVDCDKNLDELIAVITDGKQQMKDDERIKRIDKLYRDLQDTQVFVQSFSNDAKGLAIQRRNDQYDIQIQRKLNGLK